LWVLKKLCDVIDELFTRVSCSSQFWNKKINRQRLDEGVKVKTIKEMKKTHDLVRAW